MSAFRAILALEPLIPALAVSLAGTGQKDEAQMN
jgi:hypothetical protein